MDFILKDDSLEPLKAITEKNYLTFSLFAKKFVFLLSSTLDR